MRINDQVLAVCPQCVRPSAQGHCNPVRGLGFPAEPLCTSPTRVLFSGRLFHPRPMWTRDAENDTRSLETALVDLSRLHYDGEIARVRQRVDILNQTTEVVMLVRYQYKIAFLLELKQETKEALREYQRAYDSLQRIKVTDGNAVEVKAVAGAIMAEICRLLFITQAPLDALGRFRNHLANYKQLQGPDDRLFLHYSWWSDQYRMFATLFEGAVSNGLGAIQTEHPGFYFRYAASHARTSQRLSSKLQGDKLPEVKLLEPVYVGQPVLLVDGKEIAAEEITLSHLAVR